MTTPTTPTPSPTPTESTAASAPLLRDVDHLRHVLDVPFSEAQAAAITAPLDRPLAIVAGAGSGKTAVMTARVVWLVGTGQVEPGRVLGLTFTNKAAGELAGRVRLALGLLARDAGQPDLLDRLGEPTVSTYHAYAGGLLAEHGLRLGLEPDARVVTDATRYQRAASVVVRHRRPLELVSTHVSTATNALLALDGELHEHLVAVDDVRSFDAEQVALLQALDAERTRSLKLLVDGVATLREREELLGLVEDYRAAKTRDGVVDFSDQMAQGARLGIEVPEVGADARERFGVVLLDEYQDTSVAQRMMLQGLFSGAADPAGQGHPVTAVGDPCQAIYGWRGASSDNLSRFGEHFPAADGTPAERLNLTVNRRCGRRVLAVANTVAAPLYEEEEAVRPLDPADDAIEGEVGVGLFETVDDEIADVVARIRAAHDDPPTGTAPRWSDVAVLVRTKSEISALAEACWDADVPVEVVGLAGLLGQPEVADVLSLLEVVAAPTANPATLRLLTGPRWRVGGRDLALLGSRARDLVREPYSPPGDDAADVPPEQDPTALLEQAMADAVAGLDPSEVVSLSDAVADPGRGAYSAEARARFRELADLVRQLRSRAGEPLVDVVRAAVTALDLDVELALHEGGRSAQGRDDLALLLEVVAAFAAASPTVSLDGLLAYLQAENEQNGGMEVAAPSEADSVKVMTAHKAKGLEFAVVLVPFVSGGLFPSGQGRSAWTSSAKVLPTALRGDAASLPDVEEWSNAGDKDYRARMRVHDRAEETRLAYVALTRAKRSVHVSGHRWGRTQKKPRAVSPYLEVVRGWLAEHGVEPVAWAADPAEGLPEGTEPTNPMLEVDRVVAWPADLPASVVGPRREVADLVGARLETAPTAVEDLPPLPEATGDAEVDADLARLARLDTDLGLLVAEQDAAVDPVVVVPVPAALSVTAVQQLHADPAGFARSLARPMPRRPSSAARFGTRFHAWVEARLGQLPLLDADDLPGRSVDDVADEAELAELREAFDAGPFAAREPYAVETAFTVVLGGQQVRGRIDAVYRTDDGDEVVDWKTNRSADADPLQLELYRLAWAEMQQVPPASVRASFYYVRLGRVVTLDSPRGRPELEAAVRAARSGGRA